MAIYMKYTGIDGQVTAPGFEKQTQLSSCQFGVGRGVTSVSKNANREAGSPNVSEITVTKTFDESSVNTFNAALFGKGVQVVISFTKTSQDGKADQVYMTFTLDNTIISGYSLSSGGDLPSESFSLNFTKIEMKSFPSDLTNKAAKPQVGTWNLATGATA